MKTKVYVVSWNYPMFFAVKNKKQLEQLKSQVKRMKKEQQEEDFLVNVSLCEVQ